MHVQVYRVVPFVSMPLASCSPTSKNNKSDQDALEIFTTRETATLVVARNMLYLATYRWSNILAGTTIVTMVLMSIQTIRVGANRFKSSALTVHQACIRHHL